MAFSRTRLSLIGNSGNSDAPRVWSYKTADAHATVDSAGYFNLAGDKLKVGDIIHVVVVTNLGASNEAVATYGTHIVNSVVASNGAFVVDVSDVTVNVVTDTD
jgi:hypothetical protein